MPIWKSESDDTLMIEMGFGDVCVASGRVAGKDHDDEIVFYTGAKGEIGADNAGDIGKLSTQVKAKCRIVFHDPRSIDVVMKHLEDLRSALRPEPVTDKDDEERKNCGPCLSGRNCQRHTIPEAKDGGK